MAKKTKRRTRTQKTAGSPAPQQKLAELSDAALGCGKTARRNKQSLTGDNFYANKLATLRADATNAYQSLGQMSIGDTTALADLIESVFAPDTNSKARAQAVRDLQFELQTKWKTPPTPATFNEDGGVFPLAILSKTRRGYLSTIGRQANGAYDAGWYDACAVMMRRLLESSIIEAFEANKIDNKIKDDKDHFFQLTKLTEKALAESWNLPRAVNTNLKELALLGHRSAHNRYYTATKDDIDKYANVFREAIEAFLHLASLL